MIKRSLYFAILLLGLLLIVAGLHLVYLYANQIAIATTSFVLCYGVNYLLALAIYITLLRMAEDQNKYLGFVFLFGSVLKFLVYFLIFDPLFRQDGDLSRVEFFLFFTPYLISLIAETVALVKLMRTLH